MNASLEEVGAPHLLKVQVEDGLEVSIILPCLNEAATVGTCVRDAISWFEASGVRGEVIVADNGSTDGSDVIAAEAGARVVHEERRGKGNATRRGIDEAQGRYIFLADADGTYDLRNLDAFVEALRGGAGMVAGNRLQGHIEAGAMPALHRYVGNPVFSLLISLITRRRFGDVLTGLYAMPRDVWAQLGPRSNGFEMESEICLRAGRRGLKVAEVPVNYYARRTSSKLRAFTHGWAIARFIVLDSADILFVFPALLAILLGALSLIIGAADTHGVPVGSVRWQPVFAGGILVPGGVALLTCGALAKWLSWRQGIAGPGWIVRFSNSRGSVEVLLVLGALLLSAGLGLDAYLLTGWASGESRARALGLGAISQALVVSGLNIAVAALLLGVLHAAEVDVPGRNSAA